MFADDKHLAEARDQLNVDIDDDNVLPVVWRSKDASELFKVIENIDDIFRDVIPYWEKRGATSYTKILRKIGRGVCPHSIIIDDYINELAMLTSVLAHEMSTSFPYPNKPIFDQPAIFFDVLGVYRQYEAIKNVEATKSNSGRSEGNDVSVRRGDSGKPVLQANRRS